MITTYLVIFLICSISGIFTGLLGIGGGLIIIPMFLLILPMFSLTFSLHEIIGISAACVFLNSGTTLFYRRKEEFLEKNFLIKLAISIAIGTVLGSYFSSFAPKKLLLSIYVLVSLCSLFLMYFNITFQLKKTKLLFLLYFIFAIIGAISSSIGIGGAILFATALKCFLNKEPKFLLPSITLLVFSHALFAFFSKLFLGEISLFIIPIALLASLIGAKIGVKISKKLSALAINRLLCLTLILSLVKIILELFSS